jgi:predicted small integral membrane protein
VKELPGASKAVNAALAAWSQQAGAPKLSLGKQGAKLTPGLDGTNGIFYAKDGYAPAGGALAITVLSFDEQSGEVLDADIILNGKYDLGTIDASLPAPVSLEDRGAETYDIGRVLAHEMGHALALSDEPANEDALMYPYVARAKSLRAAPASDDLEGLETLYTDASAGDGASAAGCSGSGTRPGTGAAWGALGLGVAALALARKRRAAASFTTLAAVVMLVPVSASASPTAEPQNETFVTRVSTTNSDGIFQSDVTVSDGVVVSHHTVWGGTVGGVRQIVGGAPVPRAGERVRLVLTSRGSGGSKVTRLVLRSAE